MRNFIDRNNTGPRMDCASKRQRETRYARSSIGQLDFWLVNNRMDMVIILGNTEIIKIPNRGFLFTFFQHNLHRFLF